MNFQKTIATTVAAATLGVGAFALSGVASASGPTTAGAADATTPTTTPTTPRTTPTTPGAATGNAHRHGHRRVGLLLRRAVLRVSAKTIGIAPKDLIAQLKAGKSIAEVSTAHGVDPSAVVTALVKAGNQRIDQAVKKDKLDAGRAAKLKAKLPDLAQRAVDFHRQAAPTTTPTTSTPTTTTN